MYYHNNSHCNLDEIIVKAKVYKTSKVINKRIEKELLGDFLHSLYSLFEFVKSHKSNEQYVVSKFDYTLYFRSQPVVLAKLVTNIAEFESDLFCKSMFSTNKTIRYMIFSDGFNYTIYHRVDDVLTLYTKFNLLGFSVEDKVMYSSMGSMDIIHEIDDELHKSYKSHH